METAGVVALIAALALILGPVLGWWLASLFHHGNMGEGHVYHFHPTGDCDFSR